ncbi:helix-turn-helix transcriptional regulator [Allorhizobium sp. BGMRC 0089]|uniref:AraC family transcriptional regulator n=1 Tax=Allorhizobium sonneratiae TaxID=2934936 RepID=UPI0020347A32|nr:AraC family transcriptional regulator [Allorhizobium sonneratiae]MCM2294618.1 helix-turn-helix transcriptional regulator [Allorhizobium sonneratiae]
MSINDLMFSGNGDLPDTVLLSSDMAAQILLLLEQASHSAEADPSHMQECIVSAQHLLSTLCRRATLKPTLARYGLAPWQADRIARHVDACLDQPIRMEDLADMVRLSVSHFSRAFRHHFGVPPYAYVLSRRLARAKRLLQETDESLAQVALACGMADQAHFSRLFRRMTGESPSQWRRRMRS